MAYIQETADKIRKEIINYISGEGHPFEEWYLGISDDPGGTLDVRHGVNMNPTLKRNWNYWNAESKENAYAIHRSIKDTYDTQGDALSRDATDSMFTHLYAYHITSTTQENH
jgi:hypothetical protein